MSVAEPRQNALPQKYISTLWKLNLDEDGI